MIAHVRPAGTVVSSTPYLIAEPVDLFDRGRNKRFAERHLHDE